MTLAFSSSSPIVSVALFDSQNILIDSQQTESNMKASGGLLDLLDKILAAANVSLSDVDLFATDLGPGSFTGVKVAVTVCKTFAYAQKKPVCGATSFDLIDPEKLVAIPSKKNEYFIKEINNDPFTKQEVPEGAIGYGKHFESPHYPSAAGFEKLLKNCERLNAVNLVPYYVSEPSISKPKTPRLLRSADER